MHIPSQMLHGAVCPITAVMAVTGLAAAVYFARQQNRQPSPAYFAAVTALLFAGQMLNFPILQGTSGHLLGGVIAAALLGTPFAVLATALVLTLQALVFADGGLDVLGANIVNMALLGTGAAGWALHQLQQRALPRWAALSAAGMLSVLLAATACSLELAWGSSASLNQVLPSMLSVHGGIALAEAALTVLAVHGLTVMHRRAPSWQVATPMLAAVLGAGVLSPWASRSPDGLAWVSTQLGLLKAHSPMLVTPLQDYSLAGVQHAALATGLAGIIGVAMVFAAAHWVSQHLQKHVTAA